MVLIRDQTKLLGSSTRHGVKTLWGKMLISVFPSGGCHQPSFETGFSAICLVECRRRLENDAGPPKTLAKPVAYEDQTPSAYDTSADCVGLRLAGLVAAESRCQ
jgi:hypothetical protein